MSLSLRTNRLPDQEVQGRTKALAADLPKLGSFDVVVVGGGTAGAVAAIVAGQEGLHTAVVEPQAFLGGIGTGGGIHMYYHGLQTGVQVQIDERTDSWNKRLGGKASGFHPEAKKLALQELANEAQVRCFYNHFFVGAVLEGKALRGVAVEGPLGPGWIEAKTVIDSTGDADVAAAAGSPFRFGRSGDHAPQPYSLAPGFVKNLESVGFHNFDAGYIDATNARDQSRAQFEGRTHLRKTNYEEANRMLYVSPILGLRESRFIDAEYVVTLEDQVQQRRFADCIARAKAHYDNHALDYENESLEAALWVTASGNWRTLMCHDVPYRCMVPLQIENLLVACRAVGMTHDAHQLFRMQRDMQALGEAAAVAAGVAQRNGTSVRKVDVKTLQKRLVERGALAPEALEGKGLGTTLPADEEMPKADVAKLFSYFGTDREGPAQTELMRRGASAHGALREALGGQDENAKLMAALNLGLQGKTDGVAVLQATVRARRQDQAKSRSAGARWAGALFVLEKLGAREHGAIPLALEILLDQELSLAKAVQSVRLLGRHATAAEALEAVRTVLKRPDIQGKLTLQVSSSGAKGSMQDRHFELHLAAAEAFAHWGAVAEAREIAERYTADHRALVRGYARKVLQSIAEPVAAQ